MYYYAKVDQSDNILEISRYRDEVVLDSSWVLIQYQLPPRPSDNHTAKLINGEAVWIDCRSIEEAKLAKRAQINEWRLAANYSGFMHGGKLIASDPLSMLDITNTANEINQNNALPANWPGAWKAVDNSYVSISTIQDWRSFYSSMYQRGLQNFAISQQLKSQLDAIEPGPTALAKIEEDIVWPT